MKMITGFWVVGFTCGIASALHLLIATVITSDWAQPLVPRAIALGTLSIAAFLADLGQRDKAS